MGHSELDCEEPTARNALGKLPYDIKLRALDEKKRRFKVFLWLLQSLSGVLLLGTPRSHAGLKRGVANGVNLVLLLGKRSGG